MRAPKRKRKPWRGTAPLVTSTENAMASTSAPREQPSCPQRNQPQKTPTGMHESPKGKQRARGTRPTATSTENAPRRRPGAHAGSNVLRARDDAAEDPNRQGIGALDEGKQEARGT